MMKRILLMWWELSLTQLHLWYHLHPLRVPLLPRKSRKQALHLSNRLLSHLQDVSMLSLTSSRLPQRLAPLLSHLFPSSFHPHLSLHHRLASVVVVPLFARLALSLSLALLTPAVSSEEEEDDNEAGDAGPTTGSDGDEEEDDDSDELKLLQPCERPAARLALRLAKQGVVPAPVHVRALLAQGLRSVYDPVE
jgi:hypothetical protein